VPQRSSRDERERTRAKDASSYRGDGRPHAKISEGRGTRQVRASGATETSRKRSPSKPGMGSARGPVSPRWRLVLSWKRACASRGRGSAWTALAPRAPRIASTAVTRVRVAGAATPSACAVCRLRNHGFRIADSLDTFYVLHWASDPRVRFIGHRVADPSLESRFVESGHSLAALCLLLFKASGIKVAQAP
jgi:hypothetical protein